ncbi:MAG: hypothetical protein Q8S14_09305, partial [Algoriphagus sp.]|nr:hypothetical protein [Algoriphagus sp.]
FLISSLGLMGFPLSPTFIGEDLLFSHIHQDQYLLAFLAALAFVMEGIASVRIFARLFLGAKLAGNKKEPAKPGILSFWKFSSIKKLANKTQIKTSF